MNKKLTVRDEWGNLRYCILSPNETIEAQVGRFMQATGGAGLSTRIVGDELQIYDYFHAEECGIFKIISLEDTPLACSLKWTLADSNNNT